MALLSQKSQKTTRITTNLHFAEQLHPKSTVFSLCWVQGLLQIHVAMHRSEAKPMPSHIWVPKRPVPQPSHNFPIVKLSLLPQSKAWTSILQISNTLFSQKKKVSVAVANRAAAEGSLQTAQPNGSNSHQPSEATQRLQNMRAALKGL